MKFVLDGCDINFIAEAPKNITLKQLLVQCDRIKPHWCACGIRSCDEDEINLETDIIIDYNNVWKANDDINCEIEEDIQVGDECEVYAGDRVVSMVVVTKIDRSEYTCICMSSIIDGNEPGELYTCTRTELKRTGRRIEYHMTCEPRNKTVE